MDKQLLFQFLDACGLGVLASLGANGRAAIGASSQILPVIRELLF